MKTVTAAQSRSVGANRWLSSLGGIRKEVLDPVRSKKKAG